MKKFKKLIALACVATMLIPSVAFAAEQTPENASPVTSTADSVVENDNSKPVEYTKVVVPTIPENTYRFTIDPYKLLDQYDSAYDYEGNVYFTAVKDRAYVTPETNVTLAVQEYDVETFDGGALQTALLALSAEVTDNDLAGYYVWVPTYDTVNTTVATGYGEFIPLEADTIANYITLTEDPDFATSGKFYLTAALAADPLSGTDIWDGNIYKLAYTTYNTSDDEVCANIVETHDIVVENDVVTKVTDLYAKSDSDPDYVKVTVDNWDTYFSYTEATIKYAGTSNSAKITNKSTNAIAVSVTVNLKAPGLDFDDDGTFDSDETTASIFAAITDTTTNEAKVAGTDGNGTATAYYVIPGADRDPLITFQGSATEGSATGSHNYYNYEAPGTTFFSQSFDIDLSANGQTDDATKAAWDAYVALLNATDDTKIDRPEIEVVYTWVSLGAPEDVLGDNPNTEGTVETDFVTGKKYLDETKNEYVTGTTNGWAAFTTGHVHTYTDLADTTCNDEECTTGNRPGITKALKFSLNGAGTSYFVAVGTGATINSVNIYDAEDYANNGSSATVLKNIETSAITVSGTGNALISTETLDGAVTTPGEYVYVLDTSKGIFTVVYTVSE